MHKSSKQYRVLAISLSNRGIGYAVIENEKSLIAYGKRRIIVDKHKSTLKGIEKLYLRYQPDYLVLQDVNDVKGNHRVARIKRLHKATVDIARGHKLRVKIISGWAVRSVLLNNKIGTKHELAEFLAAMFPDELAGRLPPKRMAWMNPDDRMDIFDAVGLAVAICRYK